MTKTVKVKRLYYGFASIRDYLVAEASKKGQDLRIDLKGTYMTIPWNKLSEGREDHKTQFSKFTKKTYKLIDFRWKEDRKQLREEAEGQKGLYETNKS